MWVCYALVQNFGWAIIIFSFIIKAAMFPINLKQQKSMAVSQLFMPRVREIQTKYKNNQQKQQEELAQLQKEGYNPTGGCLPILLSFIILTGVIGVVYKPMTHMEHFSGETINAIVASAKNVEIAEILKTSPDDYNAVIEYLKDESTIAYVETEVEENGKKVKQNNRIVPAEGYNLEEARKNIKLTKEDIEAFRAVSASDDKLNAIINNTRLSNEISNALRAVLQNYNEQMLYREIRALNSYDRATARNDGSAELLIADAGIDSDITGRFIKLSQNMYFFGLNLGEQPTMAWNMLVIVPILSFVLSMAQMLLSQYYTNKQNPEMAKQQGSMKIMLLTMPFVSLWISFSVPAGAGFYWALSYLFAMLQSVITYKFWPSDKIRAEAQAKMDAAAAAREQRAKVVTVDAEGNTVEKTDRISQLTKREINELNKKKLEAARRADAEKYGEEYIESPDDDL